MTGCTLKTKEQCHKKKYCTALPFRKNSWRWEHRMWWKLKKMAPAGPSELSAATEADNTEGQAQETGVA